MQAVSLKLQIEQTNLSISASSDWFWCLLFAFENDNKKASMKSMQQYLIRAKIA